MRTANIIKLICWIVVAAILIGVLVYGVSTGSVGGIINRIQNEITGTRDDWNAASDAVQSGGSAVSSDGSYSVPAEGVSRIGIDWISGSVEITPYSGTEIRFTETSNQAITDNLALNYTVSGNALHINFFKDNSAFTARNISKKLELLVPQSIAAALDELEVNTVSAEIEVSGVSARTVELGSTSGEIDVEACQATKLSLSATSGAITAEGCACDKLDTNCVSGKLEFSGSASDINSDSISGALSFELDMRPDSINANTVSGSISLALPDNDGFRARVEKISGNVDCAFPTVSENGYRVYGDGSAVFSFDTVSGAVRIEKID